MVRKNILTTTILIIGTAPLYADFTYEQSSKVTGGMMAGMMKAAGVFSKEAREPMQSTVSVKGGKMSTISARRISLIDLDAETMTEIDLDKKTYAVITFADFRRAMEKMTEKMSGKNDASLTFKASVNETGQTRVIDGLPTKEMILKMDVEGQDQKSGNKGAMNIVTDIWLAASVPGYKEVTAFHARMGEKLGWSSSSGGMGAMMRSQPGMMKGMSELAKESSKLEGVPVLQIVRMGGSGEGLPNNSNAEPEKPAPSASEAALGKLGLGGFGGFGRKKKAEKEPEPEKPAASAPNSLGPAPAGMLMEITTELSAFSTATADSAKFAVPEGFKQVQHDLEKALK